MVTNERGAVIITGLKSNCQTEISGERSSNFRLWPKHMAYEPILTINPAPARVCKADADADVRLIEQLIKLGTA